MVCQQPFGELPTLQVQGMRLLPRPSATHTVATLANRIAFIGTTRAAFATACSSAVAATTVTGSTSTLLCQPISSGH